jgi:hypothetical protein
MESLLVPGVYYNDTSRDITEHDLDIVSDLWTIDGREVYRGARDPRYTHANVYWLYSEDLDRVGLSEHSLTDQADFRVLWFRETDFGTYLQEDGWERGEDIWSALPRCVFDRFVNETWTTPKAFLEQCLYGPVRILTPEMLHGRPEVYVCNTCGKRSLTFNRDCQMVAEPLDFPTTEKLFFVDEDMIVYRPPPTSRVWDLLRPLQTPSPSGGSQEPGSEQAQPQAPRSPPPEEAPRTPEQIAPPPAPSGTVQQQPSTPAQSRP